VTGSAARALAVAAAIVLLADLPGPFTRGDMLRSALLPTLAAAAAIAVARDPRRGGGWPALAAFLPAAVPLLGLVGGPGGAAAALRATAPWFSLAVLASALAAGWRTRDDAMRAWRMLLIAGALAAIWTVFDAAARGGGGVGPFGRPGIAGPVLGALLAAAVALPARLPRTAKPLLVLALAAGVAATGSRVGILVGLVAALTSAAAARRGRAARALAISAATATLLGGAVFFLGAGGSLPLPGGEATARVRVGLWRTSLALAGERPLPPGHGLGSLPVEMLRARDPEEARLSLGRRPDQAHQEFLRAAVEGGWPAALALLAWAGAAGVLLRRGLRRASDPAERGLLAAAGGALAAILLAALAEEPLRDPAGALLAATAFATLARGIGDPPRAGRRVEALSRLAMVPVLLACAGVLARAAVADHHLRRYRDAISVPVTVEEAQTLARERLAEGAIEWRPDHPEALYRLGVTEAEAERYDAARERLRAALAADPGMTEALLDIARTFEREGRPSDARDALLEARRRDPTRYEIPLRLGHLAMGPEPMPGDPPDPSFAPVEPTRLYNEAEALDPSRFETWVARARVARRMGDLRTAAGFVVEAGKHMAGAGEVLLELFRQSEAVGGGETEVAARLAVALAADPRLADPVRREALRILDEAERREEDMRAAAARDPAGAAFDAVEALFDRAAYRLAAVLLVAPWRAEEELASARKEAEERRWRRSLARFRAVLARANEDARRYGRLPPPQSLGIWGDLFLEAAKVASRVEGARAREFYARGHAIVGAEMLGRRRWLDAARLFRLALEKDSEFVDAWHGLARALAQQGPVEEAEQALLEALRLDPARREALRTDPDLEPLRERPRVRTALAGE
jgi:tetratricopeptide (TPR) repeat protein